MFQWMPFSSGFISFDNIPVTVPNNLIRAIRRHVHEINALAGKQLVGVQSGDVVMIEGGLFDGYEAIFDVRLPGSESVRVLQKLLKARQFSVELTTAHIQPPRQSHGK